MNQIEMITKYGEQLIKAPVYSKFGVITARPAKLGETITTITSTGEETVNVAKEGDFIVTNSTDAGEEYILSGKKLSERYEPLGNEGELGKAQYKATGQCRAIIYNGPTFKFTAHWNSEMVCNDGDMLVSNPEGEVNEIYRIDLKEFGETYQLPETVEAL